MDLLAQVQDCCPQGLDLLSEPASPGQALQPVDQKTLPEKFYNQF